MNELIIVRTGRKRHVLVFSWIVVSGAVLAPTAGSSQRVESPAAIWAAGPLDVVAAFRQAVSPDQANALIGQTIPYFDLRRARG